MYKGFRPKTNRFGRYVPKVAEPKVRINHQIKAPEIRLVSEQGKQLGILKFSEALDVATEHGLDLVEINPSAVPPVVKLISYDKFRYQQEKVEKQKSKTKKTEVKVIRLTARISSHDSLVKAKKADEFLGDGDLVKIELRLKGRENAFADLAQNTVTNFLSQLTVAHKLETPLKKLGGNFIVTISPSK